MPTLLIALYSLFSIMFRSDDPAPADDQPATRADIKKYIKTLIAGDPDQAAEKLAEIMKDNQKYRASQHRLTDEQWADYQAYQSLGKPSEIKVQIERVPALESDLETFRQEKRIKDLARAAKIANTDALADLVGSRDFEIVPVQQADGSTVDQVLIVEGTTKTPIREFVKAHKAWAEPILFPATDPAAQGVADSNSGAAQGVAPNLQQPAAQGARPVAFAQGQGAAPPAQGAGFNPSELAEKFNTQRSAGVKNPLAPN
jgi:hypothetical protein